jgi:hypothetical protein
MGRGSADIIIGEESLLLRAGKVLEFIPNTSSISVSASIYLPFYNGEWWSVLVNSGSDGFTLYAADKNYNGEDGYVNRLDLTTQNGTSSSPETFPLEEPEIEEPTIVEPADERENEPSEEVVKESWKSWLVLPKISWDEKYLWGLLIIPVLFLTLLILSLLRSRKRKVNLQEDYYSSSGNQENKNFWDQQDKTSWEQQDKTIHNQQEKTTFDNTYSEPIKVHRWQDFPGKDDKTIIDR